MCRSARVLFRSSSSFSASFESSQFLPCTVHDNSKLVRLIGFGDKVISALFHGLYGGFDSGVPGYHNHQDPQIHFHDPPENFHPVHTGHLHVQEDNGNGFFLYDVKAFIPPACLQYRTSHPGKDPFGTVPEALLIINNQDLCGIEFILHYHLPHHNLLLLAEAR